MENQNDNSGIEPVKHNSAGIEQWNDRLDENLESEETGDVEADEKAKDFSAHRGSGDQSDEAAD